MTLRRGLDRRVSLEPWQKLLVFLKCIKSVKYVSLLTKESIDGVIGADTVWGGCHDIRAIILLIINQHDAKTDKYQKSY